MKKLIVFDLDGTLAESKSSLDTEMSRLLDDRLGILKVAVISGGDWPQFERQVLSHLTHDKSLVNLSILPTRIGVARVRFKADGDPVGVERLGIALCHFQREARARGISSEHRPPRRSRLADRFDMYYGTADSPIGAGIIVAGRSRRPPEAKV